MMSENVKIQQPLLLKVLQCLLIFFKAWNLHNLFVRTPILVFLVSLEIS